MAPPRRPPTFRPGKAAASSRRALEVALPRAVEPERAGIASRTSTHEAASFLHRSRAIGHSGTRVRLHAFVSGRNAARASAQSAAGSEVA